MFFRNLQVFRIAGNWQRSSEQLSQLMARTVLMPCSALSRYSQGWISPRGIKDELVVSVGQQMLICLGIEQKILPPAVIREYVADRAHELEEQQGFKPGRKQLRDLFDAVEAELLPQAFIKRRRTFVWLDFDNAILAVDASSTGKSDEVIEQLKLTLGELPLTILKTVQAPGTAMTQWVSLGEVPGPFSIDQDCALRVAGESGGKVKYTRHPLDAEELNRHINRGKVVGELALTWNDRISFVLTEQMQIKRLAFLDVLKEQAEQASEGDDSFMADFTIMSGECAAMLGALVNSLGGEVEDYSEDQRSGKLFERKAA